MITVGVKHNMDSFITEMTSDIADIRDKVMVRALNKMADQVKVASAREVKAQGYNLKISDIKRGIKVRYASAGQLRSVVIAQGRPIPLIKYGASQSAAGVVVNVKAGRKVIAGAFIATMPSGHTGVFVRQANAKHRKVMTGPKASWHALPIRELFGPSVPDGLANAAVQASLQQLIVERFPQILERENSWARRSARR